MTIVEPAAPAPAVPGPRPPRCRLRRAALAGVGVVVAVGLFAGGYAYADHRRGDTATMDARAAAVMPFDLTATAHTFTKNDHGGVEQVVVKDPADQHNLDLIRSHLQHEATEFANGNFADPAAIHGADMPGLTRLQAATGRLTITYQALPTGARITYSATDLDVVAAIHDWFDAQTSDHAMPGMGG